MAIRFELNELASPTTRQRVETAIQKYIGAQAEAVDWHVWIFSAGLHHRVVINGPTQTREQIFLERQEELIESLTRWLELYPFR